MGARLPAVLAALLLLGCGGDETRPPPTRILWKTTAAPGIYYASPALSADGTTLYVGTSTPFPSVPGGEHAFVALDTAHGRVRWRHPLDGSQVRSTPAVAEDGSIFVAVELARGGDLLLHLSAAGEALWTRDINPSALPMTIGQSAPAIGPDGTVYVAGDRLYAFAQDGTLRWTALEPTGEAMRNAPVIGADGTVYFVTHNVPLTALDPADGSPRWTLPLGVNDHCFASPAIGADGTIYVATDPGVLHAVSTGGQPLWTFSVSSAGFAGHLRSSPAIDANGNLHFGMTDGAPSPAFFSITRDGSLRWTFVPPDLPAGVPLDHFDIYSSPAIGDDGAVYFGQELGRVYALDAETGTQRWKVDTGTGITWSSPVLGPSVLHIADMDGTVYAIRTGSTGSQPGSPWPGFRHDGRHTGSAAVP